MALSLTEKKRIRKSFGRLPAVVDMPNLIEVQRASYETFLQMGPLEERHPDEGLGAVFKSVFPIIMNVLYTLVNYLKTLCLAVAFLRP